jgi:ribosomal protein L37AE/L43A
MATVERTIRTFDPLLRDLITWNLVKADGDRWELSERAQRRLAELAEASASWPAERTVYMGHRCDRCGARGMTRLREGAYVCDPCWSRPATPPDAPVVQDGARRRRIRLGDRRIA